MTLAKGAIALLTFTLTSISLSQDFHLLRTELYCKCKEWIEDAGENNLFVCGDRRSAKLQIQREVGLVSQYLKAHPQSI